MRMKMAMRRAVLAASVLVVLLMATWVMYYNLEAGAINRAFEQGKDASRSELMERRLNGLDKMDIFWDSDWDEAAYDQHIENDHLKTGLFAGLRTFLAELYEAFWFYIIGLAKSGRSPLILHRLMKDYLAMIGGAIVMLIWVVLAARTEKAVAKGISKDEISRSEYSRLFRSCRPSIVTTILQLVLGFLMALIVLVHQSFEPGSLVIVGVIYFIGATIRQLLQGPVGEATDRRRSGRSKDRTNGCTAQPLPRNIFQVIMKELGIRYW